MPFEKPNEYTVSLLTPRYCAISSSDSYRSSFTGVRPRGGGGKAHPARVNGGILFCRPNCAASIRFGQDWSGLGEASRDDQGGDGFLARRPAASAFSRRGRCPSHARTGRA